MEIILTNDDGIDAPGIQALFQSLEGEKIIIAPKDHHSGCGHQVTTHKPLHTTMRSKYEIAVHGTPADCSRIGISHYAPNADWVISGINAGGNLGVDLYISGTAAAAREATILGKRAIAISHWIRESKPIDWNKASLLSKRVFSELFLKSIPENSFWNINLPHVFPNEKEPEIIYCDPSSDQLPVSYRIEGNTFHYTGEYSKRYRKSGSDVDVCFSGNIAVSLIRI